MAPESSVQRRVLVAVSSSRNSKDALAWTLEKLVTKPDDILMLLHVLKPVQYVSTPDGYKDVSQVDQVIVQKIGLEARRVGGELLESFEDLCAPKRVEPLTKLVEGDRRKVILEEIDRMGATDLVMGGKARRIMPKLKSTNLIDYCLKHARCAVSIIRKGQVIQSSPAKPALIKPPTEPAPPKGPVSGMADESTTAPLVNPLPAGPEVAALTESDRARWRSVADNPAFEDGSKGSKGEQTRTPVIEAAPGGAENGREITPGEVDTGSEFMARYIVKARAEELTLALEKLESDGGPNTVIGDQSSEEPSEKEVPARQGAAAEQAPDSETAALPSRDLAKDASAVCKSPSPKRDPPAKNPSPKSCPPAKNPSPKKGPAKNPSPKRDPPAKNPSPKSDPPAKNPSPKRNGSPRASRGAAKAGKGRKGSKGSAFELKQIEQALTALSTAADVAAVGGDRPAGSPAVSDKEVDPNSLSLNEVHVEEVKSPTKPTDDRFDSEASLLEHENSFGAFKSQSSTDQELLNLMTVAKKDPVEKAGEVNGFIQYKRPETPEFTRGLEVLEILDRWLVAKQELTSRSQSEESFLSEPSQINGREAPARSGGNKKGGRFSRLFRGRGKKEELARGKKAPATAGTLEPTAGAAEMTPGTEVKDTETDRAVEEFWEDSPPPMLADGGADEPGLLSRIADVIIAEEEEKARREVIEGPATVPDRSSVNPDVGSAVTNEVLDRTGLGELGCETDRAETARENMRRMLEEEDAETQSPQVPPAKSTDPEPKTVAPGKGLKVVIPEGQPPAGGRVKVKVQMLHTEAREAPPANSPRPPGVSRRVSRALLEGMVPELPREEPEERPGEGAPRPSIAPPQQGPNPDPNVPDKYRQELSKYTLEGWLGIGQCVTRFLEDDRSSISSEAYESLGGSLDTGTPVSCSWEGEPADVAAVQHQHVADDWGYGSSRLGARPEEAAGLRGVPAVDNRSQWKPAVQDQSAGVPDAQVAEFMKEASEAREQVSEQRPGSESEAPGVASTSGAARADYDARRDKKLRSPFSSYWTPEAATSAPDESQALSSAPKFGGIALRTDSRPGSPETLAARPPSARVPSPEPPVSSRRRKSERKSERGAYDPRKWAIPLQREEETRVLRRHPSEVELFGEEEDQEVFRAPVYQEDELSADSLSALTISQAITDLAASTFADLVSDGRISTAQVAQWRDEIAWLTSPGDQVTELVASTVETKTGSMKDIVVRRPRADVQTSLPALRALDDLLQRIVLRMNAGKAATKRELMGTREQTVQVLKAALMINEEVLQEMAVPNAYWATLPKTIKQVLGSETFNALTSKAANPAHLLMVVNPKTPEHAWRTVNNLEAAIHMWRSMMVDLAEPLAKKRATYASRASTLVHDLKMTWPSLEATELAEFKITRNTDVGRAILESYSRALISLCGKTITCLDYLLTLEPPAEKSGRRPRSARPTSAKPSPPTSPPEAINTTGQPLPSPTGSLSPNGLGNGPTTAATPKAETPGKKRRFFSLRGKKSPRS